MGEIGKVLVTGGAGFIGSNFVRMLLEKGEMVVNLDKLTYAGNLNNLKGIKKVKNYSFIKGDITSKKTVLKAMKGCRMVFNFAAESHVDKSILGPAKFILTNVTGTHVLLEAAQSLGIERFVQVSTDEVYGSIENGFANEDWLLNPSSPYSASKAAGDLVSLSYFKTFGLDVVVTRSTNNFGPYQFPEKILPLFVTNILEGKKVPVYADGSNSRDWIFVKDNCRAILLASEKGKKGQVYNIGGENEMQNSDLTKKILSMLGKGEEMIEYVKDRPGHDKRYAVDFEKIKALGYKPEYLFEESFEYTVNWYRENKWWWKPLKKGMGKNNA